MRSRTLLLLVALLGIALLAYLAGRAALRGTASAPRVETESLTPGEDVRLESEADRAAQREVARAQAEGAAASNGADSDAAPPADARIEGLVVRPDGQPAALARVWRLNDFFEPLDSTVSDDEGRFVVDPAPAERELYFYASHDDFAPSETAQFELAAGEKKRDLKLALREFGRVRGLVLDAHDVPRRGVSVTCEDLDTRKALFSESDSSGRFAFERVPAGPLFVGLQLAKPELEEIRADSPFLANFLERGDQQRFVELAPGQTVEVVLGGTPSQGVRLHGKVTSAGKALPRTWIWIEDWGAGSVASQRARTDERGEYELWARARGTHNFHFMGAHGALDLTREAAITAESEQRLDFELPAGSIAGRVVDGAGQPVAAVELHLSATPAGQPEFELWMPRCAPDPSGHFEFAHLPPGRYELFATPISKPDADAPFARVRLPGLVLEAGKPLTGLEIVLRPGCTIRGQVRGMREGTSNLLLVMACDVDDERSQASTRPEVDGSFVLRGLAPGKYELRASGAGYASQLSAPVATRADAEGEVELTVEASAGLFVGGKWAAGEGPPALDLAVRDTRGHVVQERVLGPYPGPQVLLYLPRGAYQVELSSPGGWRGSETVVLEAGVQTQLEVLLRRAP